MKPRLTDDQKYEAMCRAARVAEPGHLTRTAANLLRTASHNTVQTWAKRLRQRGYDMAEWDAAAHAGRKAGPGMRRPQPAQPFPKRQELRTPAEAAAATPPRYVPTAIAPTSNPPLPYTLAGIAHIVGVSAERVLSHARYMCMPVEYGVATVVSDADARRLFGVSGFSPRAAA